MQFVKARGTKQSTCLCWALRQNKTAVLFAILALNACSAVGEAPVRRLRTDVAALGPAGALSPDPAVAAPAKVAPATGPARLTATGPAVLDLLHLIEEHRTSAGAYQNDQVLPPYKGFMSACLKHVKEVVQNVDRAYSDMQLEPVLEQECALDEEFRVMESGFSQDQVCKKFAKHLTEARMKELETGSQAGYKQFCQRYYEHKGGTIPVEKPEEPKKPKEPRGPKPDKAPKEPKEMKEPAKLDKPQDDAEGGASGNATVAEPKTKTKDAPESAPSPAPKADGKKNEKGEKEKDEKKLGKFPIVPVAVLVGGVITFVVVGLVLRSMKRGS